jgi:hypothetical protein
MNDSDNTVVSATDLFSNTVLSRYTLKVGRKINPRGEKLKLLSSKTGYSMGQICKKLEGLHDLKTLDYIISTCKDAVLTGKKKSWKHALDVEMLRIWESKHEPRKDIS